MSEAGLITKVRHVVILYHQVLTKIMEAKKTLFESVLS